MKKKLFITSGMLVLALLFILNNLQNKLHQAEAKEKRKVLILDILEENWDNLEFAPRKHKGKPFKMTKKAWMKKRQMDKYPDFSNIPKIKKGMEGYLPELLKERISKGRANKNLQVIVFHNLRYYGKTGEMKDNDIVEEDDIRFGRHSLEHFYDEIPEKIPFSKVVPTGDFHCKHIRLVEDIYILATDAAGNLQIKYGNKIYPLKAEHKIVFPTKTQVIRKNEIKGCNPETIVTKGNLYFKTKVTLVNYGYALIDL